MTPYSKIILLVTLLFSCCFELNAQCTATISPSNGLTFCQGDNTTLTANISGGVADTYQWSTTQTTQDITVNSSATYSVTVTDTSGATCISSVSVTMNPNPSPNIQPSQPQPYCQGDVVGLSVSGSYSSYLWSTGATTPSISVTTNGNYQVTVTDVNVCTGSDNQPMIFLPVPNASLTGDFINCTGTNFTTIVQKIPSSNAASYIINWGDGTPPYSGSFVNPQTHNYAQGIFTLTLTGIGQNGCEVQNTYTIYNITNPSLGAAIPANTQDCAPFSVCFGITSFTNNHPSTIYKVDFGDGSSILVLNHPPPDSVCHTYTETSCDKGLSGNAYTFEIVAGNACDTSIATVFPVRIYTPPIADFEPNPNPGCVGSPINFDNLTVEGMFGSNCDTSTKYLWDFGDGSAPILDLFGGSQTHIYNAAGLYTVNLDAWNDCDTSSKDTLVCILDIPSADFTLQPDQGCAPLPVTTTNLSNTVNDCDPATYDWAVNPIENNCGSGSQNWQFQTGSSSSSLEPTFIFQDPGIYVVSLTVTNICSTDTHYDTVRVAKTPEITLSQPSDSCGSAIVTPIPTFDPCYSQVTLISWNFPGGNPNSSNLPNPGPIVYNQPNNYTITLSVTNACGTANTSTNFTVNPLPPTPQLVSNSPLCEGDNSP